MKRKIYGLVLFVLMSVALWAAGPTAQTMELLTAQKTTVTGDAKGLLIYGPHSYQATFADVGARTCSATVLIQGSNDAVEWVTLATLSIDQTTATDGAAWDAPWRWVRAKITNISLGSGGTDPTVTVTVSPN